MQQNLDYRALDELINQQQWWFSPAYLHGALSALVVCDEVARYPEFLFFNQPVGEFAKFALPQLAEHIEQSLKIEQLSYQLMLPPEGSVSFRAEAVADWALAVSRVFEVLCPTLSEEAAEFVVDVAHIAELDVQLADHDRNQRQLMEIEEYCRVGLLSVFEALRDGEH